MEEQNKQETKTEKNDNLKIEDKKGLWFVVGAIVVAVISMMVYIFFTKEEMVIKITEQNNFPISREQVLADFENKEKKLKSEAIPPVGYEERYAESLNISFSAIESETPSQPDFEDLSEDYLNIASIYLILGNYEKSEEWNLKTLEKWPKNYKANLNLADLYIFMNQAQAAGEAFYETVLLFPKDFRVYGKFADFYHKYSTADDRLGKAAMIYEKGIEEVDDPRMLYKDYSFFLENYTKDFAKALQMEREYQNVAGEQNQMEIERLEKLAK